jgi:hypothetical protein
MLADVIKWLRGEIAQSSSPPMPGSCRVRPPASTPSCRSPWPDEGARSASRWLFGGDARRVLISIIGRASAQIGAGLTGAKVEAELARVWCNQVQGATSTVAFTAMLALWNL